MKKFLRFYLPSLITIIALGVFVLFYLVRNHENVFRCVFKKGCKVVSPAKKAIVKIDGIEASGSQIFEDERNFYLMTDYYARNEFWLLVIDKKENDVSYPSDCYGTIFSGYLILPKCREGVFLSDKVKDSDGFDAQLKITDSDINFVLPDANVVLPKYRVEIRFTGD